MKSILKSIATLALAGFFAAGSASATNYAVCVGINTYTLSGCGDLSGCIPDATHVKNLISARGQWDASNVSLLTDSGAQLTKIRQTVSNYAAKAVSGDKFLYYQSSHGGNDNYYFTTNSGKLYLHYNLNTNGTGHSICAYDAEYTAKKLATDLAAFPSGVQIVVMLDTCHSAAMFKSIATTKGKALAAKLAATKSEIEAGVAQDEDAAVEEPAPENSDAGFFMEAVLSQLAQVEAEQIRRGLRPRSAKSLASNIGWIAAADYDQYSWDGDEGGAFTEAFINGVTNASKMCDNATYGNQDGYASFYEGWNYAKDIARGQRSYSAWNYDDDDGYYSYIWTDAQCTNTTVLNNVLVGWAGKTAPSVAPTFPSATATASGYVGDPIAYTFSASGSTPITYSITSSTAPASTYSISSGVLSFTPTTANTYTFTCTAANSIGSATCTLTVTVTEPPPATPEVPSTPPSAATTSFTATWSAVSDAASYNLYVEQKVAASTSARAARDASTILTESFEDDIPSTWTKSSNVAVATGKDGDGDSCVAFKGSGAYLITEAVDNPTGVSLMYKRSGNTAAWGLDISVGPSVDGPWTSVGTISSADTTWNTYETTFTASGTVYLKFTDTRSSGAAERYVDLVQVTGDAANWVPVTGYYPVSVSGTSKNVTGLTSGTEYRYSVAAVNAAGVESEPSSYVPVTTADADSAPVWSALPDDASVTVGGTYTLDLSTYVAGSPTPIISLTTQPAGVTASVTDGVFSFVTTASTTPDDYEFGFTAANSVASDTASLTVTVNAAPVTVPELQVEALDATSAYATWSECTGVSSYTLQLASDNQFTTGGSGGEVTLFSNDATDPSAAPDGWTYNLHNTSGSYLQLMSGNYVVTEAFDASACTDLSLSLYMRTYGGTTYPSVTVEYSTDGGTTWSEPLGTLSAANTTMAERTLDVSDAAGSSSVRLRIASTSTSSSVGVGIKTIVLTGTEVSGSGSLISSTTVNDTEYTFTGLTPNTTYFARVKGNDAWSNVEEFTTDSAGDSAPVWSTIPPISVTVGDVIPNFYPANYVHGTPAPTITLSTSVSTNDYEFDDGLLMFQPLTIGSFGFTFTANNGIGSPASATLTVNSTGSVPVVSVPQTSCSTSLGGADVDFYVTATGTPTPTLALSDTTATSGYDFDPDDGYFTFIPYATGTFTFTFTATSLAGSADPVTVTVTVSAAAVTVPSLTVTNVTDTTALASWTACDGVSSYTLQLSTNEFSAGAATITDTLTAAKLGLGGSYGAGSYASGDSGAEYAAYGMTKSGGTAIQIRSNDSQSGIVVTKSPGSVTEVRVTFESSTASNRTLNVYGSASAYSSAADLYSASTPLGTIVYDGSNATGTYTINGSYAFIGIRSASGAIYLDNVEIDWTPANGGTTSKGLAKDGGDGIQTFTVNDTEYEFTGLAPESTYYARVKGTSDWSNVETFTTLAGADSAPVWSAIPAQNYLFGSNNGTFEFNVAPYASGSPSPAFYLVDTPWTAYVDDGNGDFIFEPEALGTFDFTVIASNTLGTANATLSVTVTAAPPAFVDLPSTVTGYAGEDVTFTVVATGNPAPVLDVDAADGLLFDFNPTTGLFEFNSDNTGDFEFEFTAANIAATVTQTVTVTISPAPVTVPVLTVTNVTDTTALATWTACDGVTEYTLQLTDDEFPAASGASRSATPILFEDFEAFNPAGSSSDISANLNSYTTNSGWTGSKVYTDGGKAKVGASSAQGWIMTPELTASGSLVVVWSGAHYASSTEKTTLLLGISENGTDFDEETITIGDEMTGYTNTFTVTGPTVYVRWMGSGSSKARFYLDDVSITNPGGGGSGGDDPAGDSVQEFTVTGTTYEFTGLTPATVYAARVKGNAGWSEEVLFETLGSAGTAPSIEAIADRTMALADIADEFTVTATGDPAPTFSVTSSDAPAGSFTIGENNGEFSFMPETVGTFHFTVTAANGVSPDATASFAVTVTGEAPAVTVTPATYSYEVSVGDPYVEFTVTASGHPVPTLSDSCTEGAYYIFENNAFLFDPDTAGTYHFVFTASNSEGEDSKTVTVTVSGGEPPLTAFQQWLADNGYGEHAEGEIAGNGQTYFENYIADIDPSTTNELALVFSGGQFIVDNASENRWYQFIYSTNLKDGFANTNALGKPDALPLVIVPPDAANWFGRIKVTVDEPTAP